MEVGSKKSDWIYNAASKILHTVVALSTPWNGTTYHITLLFGLPRNQIERRRRCESKRVLGASY